MRKFQGPKDTSPWGDRVRRSANCSHNLHNLSLHKRLLEKLAKHIRTAKGVMSNHTFSCRQRKRMSWYIETPCVKRDEKQDLLVTLGVWSTKGSLCSWTQTGQEINRLKHTHCCVGSWSLLVVMVCHKTVHTHTRLNRLFQEQAVNHWQVLHSWTQIRVRLWVESRRSGLAIFYSAGRKPRNFGGSEADIALASVITHMGGKKLYSIS